MKTEALTVFTMSEPFTFPGLSPPTSGVSSFSNRAATTLMSTWLALSLLPASSEVKNDMPFLTGFMLFTVMLASPTTEPDTSTLSWLILVSMLFNNAGTVLNSGLLSSDFLPPSRRLLIESDLYAKSAVLKAPINLVAELICPLSS